MYALSKEKAGENVLGILTEKPSAARAFAAALGGMSGTYQGTPYVITNAVGHLYEWDEIHKMVPSGMAPAYHRWDVANLPWNYRDITWKWKVKPGKQDAVRAIGSVLKNCDEIAIATDVDPTGEGELLAWEILHELKLRPKKWSRFYFYDEAPVSIQKAFVSRKPIVSMDQDADFKKALYRSQWDLMSMQFTRIATKYGDGQSVLRQGRLKSAMVLLVGDQLAAIKAYKKIPSYSNRFRDENGVVYTNPDEPVFSKKEQVPALYHYSDVVCDEKSMKRTSPPKFLDLAGLSSKLAAKGYSAKTVLEVYQKLYEALIVSYPRTEDKVVSEEQFREMLPLVDQIARVVGVDPNLLTHRTPRSTHVKNGGAHGANRPGKNVPASLDSLQQYGDCAPLIYETVARSYLACMAADYEYESQKGHVKDYPEFTGFTTVPKKPGWKLIFGQDPKQEDGVSAGLGRSAQPFVHEGFPPKPVNPTMEWLMKQLEKHDVGTGATRTSCYAEVTAKQSAKNKYPLLTDSRGKVGMTQFGEMSYRLLPGTHIGSLRLTEQVQADMKDIADGKTTADACMPRLMQMVREDILTMQANGENMRKDTGIAMTGNTVQKEKASGMWDGQQISFNREWCGHRFDDDEVRRLLAGESIEITANGKNGPYQAVGRLDWGEFNGHKYVGFQRTGFGGGNTIPKSWCQHVFTEDEKLLLESGKKVMLTGCVSKAGNRFDVKVSWEDETDASGTRKKIVPHFGE